MDTVNCSICGAVKGEQCRNAPFPCGVPAPNPIAALREAAAIPPRQPFTDAPKAPALKTQVGGSHYTDMAIQPMTYSMVNGLDACQHTIIKYVSRFRAKNGLQDLEKARHCLDLLIEFEKQKTA